MKTMLKPAHHSTLLSSPRRQVSVRVRTTRCIAPLALSLLSLGLLSGAVSQARAQDGDSISADAGPTVVNWPNNHFAMFTIKYENHVITYIGDQPSDGSQNANWKGTGQADFNFGFRLKDRPQVVTQPNNKTLVFVNDNNQKIWCCAMKASDDGSQIQNTGDGFTSMTINGGFDSYCIIPLPSKHTEPTLKREVYPMLLIYTQNNVVHCERLDWLAGNGANTNWFSRSSVNSGILFGVTPTEKKLSACLVPSRDAGTAAAFPYNLIVTTTLQPDNVSGKGLIGARAVRLDANGYIDPSLLKTFTYPLGIKITLANPSLQVMGGSDGHWVKMPEDIIAYVGADGRPAVNCMDTNRHPMHYVCDLSKSDGQWQWDGTYDSAWDNATYRWTPTTHYYASPTQIVKRVSVPGVTTPSATLNENTSGPYGNDHEIVRPVFRYALGGMPTKYFMTGTGTKMYNAHLKPIQFYAANQIKSLLIGIIEGPPPIPWQNINVSNPAAGSVYGSTVVNLATSTQNTIDTQSSTELIAQTAGAIGVAWDVSASVGFQQFGSISSQKISSSDFSCNFSINAPPSGSAVDTRRDIATQGTAVLLKQDCELYNYTITPLTSDVPIPGSVVYQQVALKNSTLVARPYTMSRKHGVVQSTNYFPLGGQGLVAGRLSTYYRQDSDLFNSHPMYSPDSSGGNAFDALTFSWSGGASGNQSQVVQYSNTTGTGTNFSLQVLAGVGTGDASIMVGFQSSGSITYSTTNTTSASLQSSISNVAANYTQPGLYTQYDYKTYWLQGDNAWTTNFLDVLADSPNNAGLINMIAPDSAPWVVTYGLYDLPTWNGSSWDWLTAMHQDWPTMPKR